MAQDTHAKSAHDAHHEEQVEREIGASSEPKWKHALDADEAMVAVSALGNVEIDDATNKRLLRRIDMRLMPLLCLVYALNFLDKSTLSFASVMGMKEDIRLKGDNYQWL
jgi:ACS family allantoate permease-like MFS transporter